MNAAELFEKLKNLINSQDFLFRHRICEKSFTRIRILPFHITIAIILNSVRDSTSAELAKFADYFDTLEPTKSAFSQARHKIQETAFIELNDMLIKEYYKSKVKIKLRKRSFFNNLTLLAIDGYDLQLPVSQQIIDHFGNATNASNKSMPMSSASELYDLENGFTICALNKPYKIGEREIALEMIRNFLKKDLNKDEFVFIFDTGYPSLFFLASLISQGVKFVIRCNTQFLSEVNEAVKNGEKDQLIEIPLKKLKKKDKNELIRMFPDVDLSAKLTIRICLIELSTGETEILLTSLTNKKEYSYKLFLKLYSKRWGIETDIGFQKTRMEIENFSGESVLAVQQEFYCSIFCKNSTNLLIIEAESELFKIEVKPESELINEKVEFECKNDCEIEVKCELIKKEKLSGLEFKPINGYDEFECKIKLETELSPYENLEILQQRISCPKLINDNLNEKNNTNFNNSVDQCDFQNFTLENQNYSFIQPINQDGSKTVIELKKNKKKGIVYDKAINRSVAYSRMKNNFIEALFNPDTDMDFFCNKMKQLMKKNLELIRPGRKFVRIRRYPGKKFHKNNRRVA